MRLDVLKRIRTLSFLESSQSPEPTAKMSTQNLARGTQYANVRVEITKATVERIIQNRLRYFEVDESETAPYRPHGVNHSTSGLHIKERTDDGLCYQPTDRTC